MTYDELKAKIGTIAQGVIVQVDETHARTEWEQRNNLRFCSVYALRDGQPVATVAIQTHEINGEEAIKEAVGRLDR